MKVSIPFNETITREQITIQFNDAWKKKLHANKKRLIYIATMLLSGIYLFSVGDNVAFITVFFSMYFLLNYVAYYLHYKKYKKKFYNDAESVIKKYQFSQSSSTWELTEDCFKYSDSFYDVQVKWEVVPSYKIIDKMLIVYVILGSQVGYSISEKEVGSEIFDLIVAYVKSKVLNKA